MQIKLKQLLKKNNRNMPTQNFDSLLSFINKCHEKFGLSLGMSISNELKYTVVQLPMSDAIAIYSLRYKVKEIQVEREELVSFKQLLNNLKAAPEEICKIHIILDKLEKKAQMIFTDVDENILYGNLISPDEDIVSNT